MRGIVDWTRREFLGSAAGAAAAAGGAVALAGSLISPRPAGGSPPAPPPGRPRIGCVSWCFHSFDGGSSPEEAIDLMGEIGFEGTELILLDRRDIEGFWTDSKIDVLKKKLEKNRTSSLAT
jgi:hypothetical protein